MTEGLPQTVHVLDGSDGRSGVFPPEPRAQTLNSPLPDSVQQGRQQSFGSKEIIYRKGEDTGRVYRIRSGLVKLLTYLPNGQVRIVRLRTHNHWIGCETLLGQGYWHTAVAVDATDVESVLGGRKLDEGGSWSPDCLLRQWSSDLLQADHWISDFSTGEIKPRVARLLQYLAELEFGPPAYKVRLLTVQEMADILGVTQESVSRILAGFKRGKILQRQVKGTREIYRLDPERLRQEALL